MPSRKPTLKNPAGPRRQQALDHCSDGPLSESRVRRASFRFVPFLVSCTPYSRFRLIVSWFFGFLIISTCRSISCAEHGHRLPAALQARLNGKSSLSYRGGWGLAAPPVAMLVPQKLERRFMQAATDFLKTTELRAEADLPEKVECGSITIFRRGFAISVPARDETMAPLGCHERDRSLSGIERWMRRRACLKRASPKRQVRPRVPLRMRQAAYRERPARNRPLLARVAPRRRSLHDRGLPVIHRLGQGGFGTVYIPHTTMI